MIEFSDIQATLLVNERFRLFLRSILLSEFLRAHYEFKICK